MRMQVYRVLPVWGLALVLTGSTGLFAQGIGRYGNVVSADYVDAHGDPAIMPAGYNCGDSVGCGPGSFGPGGYSPGGPGMSGPCMGGPCGPNGPCMGGPCGPESCIMDGQMPQSNCPACGGMGLQGGQCGVCGIMPRNPPNGYNDPAFDPFGGAGMNVEQCGPHYFDVGVEYLHYSRDKFFTPDTAFTTLNFAQDPANDDVRLSSSDLGADDMNGFRVIGRYDLGALSVFEATYSGFFDGDGRASFTDPNPVSATQGNLFSIFTDFGRNPAGGIVPSDPGNPNSPPTPDFEETDRAVEHRLDFNCNLQSAEASYRRYWVGFNPRVSGTLLAGFRWTQLDEDFEFFSQGNGSLTYDVAAANILTGFQFGGDGWVTLRQGLRVGSEIKAGIYNNNYDLSTRVLASDGSPNISESFSNNQVAFLSEAKASVIMDILPSLSLKGGYEILYISDLILAGGNFNTTQPYGVAGLPVRTPFLNNDGEALFHGFHAGIEYTW